MLNGVVFGFHIINQTCTTSYTTKPKRIRSAQFVKIIEDHLKTEIAEVKLIVNEMPMCTHGIFCIPKDGGGGCSIADCSKPSELSVNNFTDEISDKISYHSVDSVVNIMERNDFLTTLDISEAYRAVPIHPSDRIRQGICWQFSDNSSGVT